MFLSDFFCCCEVVTQNCSKTVEHNGFMHNIHISDTVCSYRRPSVAMLTHNLTDSCGFVRRQTLKLIIE